MSEIPKFKNDNERATWHVAFATAMVHVQQERGWTASNMDESTARAARAADIALTAYKSLYAGEQSSEGSKDG